ncbi:hypothetical protein C8R46DRAFT_1229813 [Mycena filopes]|nr:hypothetical protein C8R46DRAFT_1229813 [Mycena filopes]
MFVWIPASNFKFDLGATQTPRLSSFDASASTHLLRVHQAQAQHYIGLDVLDLYFVVIMISWLKTEDIAGFLELHPFTLRSELTSVNPEVHVVPRLELCPCVLKFSEAIHSMLNLTCIQPRLSTLVDASDSFDDVESFNLQL